MLKHLTPKKLFWLTLIIVVSVVAIKTASQVSDLLAANFSNPDSYVKLVLIRDWLPEAGYQYMARDGGPDGSYLHFSMVHTWVMQKMAWTLQVFGINPETALLLAGGGLTFLSIVLLCMFAALAVMAQGGRLAAIAAVLVLLSSGGINAYGKLVQITHHVFMQVPIALAAWLIFLQLTCPSTEKGTHHEVRDDRKCQFLLVGAGMALGLSLWISPETMPIIVGLTGVAISSRLQFGGTSLWPLAAGLLLMMGVGWLIDPPPPTFTSWALDHISFAWLLWAVVLAVIIMTADFMAKCRHSGLGIKLVVTLVVAVAGAGFWLWVTPGALAGPTGLLPEELKTLWWDRISELRPTTKPSEVLLFVLMSLLAGLALLYQAWRDKCLWYAALAVTAIAYAGLSAQHVRMSVACGLAGALAWGIWLSRKPVFYELNPGKLPNAAQFRGIFFLILPALLYLSAIGSSLIEIKYFNAKKPSESSSKCQLQDVSSELQALTPSTILLPLGEAPHLLWLTDHRVIAGNYHHNVDGILDVIHVWLSDGDDRSAQSILGRRNVSYVLVCHDENAKGDRLESRLRRGEMIDWLGDPVQIEGWNLYPSAP